MKTITVKIPMADLMSFKRNSSFIKSFGVIPIYDYVLFDSGVMVKSNQREFVIQQANFMGTFLVEERTLFNFLEYANASDILFTIDGKRVTISDGNAEVTCQTDDAENYKVPEFNSDNKMKIPANVLQAIMTAAKYCKDDENSHITPYVFIGQKSVFGADGLICYGGTFDFDLPEMILSRANAEKIGTLTDVSHAENERFHVFESKGVTFGFIKHEVKFQDMSIFFNRDKGQSFSVNKKDFLLFNEACLSISPSKIVYPTFTIEDGHLLMSMADRDYDIRMKKKIPCDGKMEGTFGYIAAQMVKLLKTATDEELTFTQSEKLYYITGESGFNALIVEIYLLQ